MSATKTVNFKDPCRLTDPGVLPEKVNEFINEFMSSFGENSTFPGYDINTDGEKSGVYIRLSHYDAKDPGLSMEIQPDSAIDYAKTHNLDVHRIYADPDYSGRNSRRPEFQRLIRDIKAGRINVLIVHRLDRLYRNTESLLKFVRLLDKHHVRLVSVTENIDANTLWGRLVMCVLSAMAETYLRQTSERIREAKKKRTDKGLSNGTVRFGYCNGLCSTCTDPNGPGYCPLVGGPDRPESKRGKVSVPHPIERHGVTLIVHLYHECWSDAEIAAYLNTNHFRLPDGTEVVFRTKSSAGHKAPGTFTRDSIRGIVTSPYYIGLVASYPTAPLDMDDDPEHPEAHTPARPDGNRRKPNRLVKGIHEAIYPATLWQENQRLRKSKGNAPAKSTNKKVPALVSGVGFCWECYINEHRFVNLRKTGSNGRQGYICAGLHDSYNKRKAKAAPDLSALDVSAVGSPRVEVADTFIAHTSFVPAANIDDLVDELVGKFNIPEDWHETILAFYQSDDGMNEFERKSYNCRSEIDRIKYLFRYGFMSKAEFDVNITALERELQDLHPRSQPGSLDALLLLKDFNKTWAQISIAEKNALLKTMFGAMFFDAEGKLRHIIPNPPFDQIFQLG